MEKYEGIEVIKTKENTYTLSVNNILIHSKYYPQKQAKLFIDNNKKKYEDKKLIVLYGLGFGYHVKELLKIVKNNCEIHIFDIYEEVFKLGNKLKVYDDLLRGDRIKFHIGYSKDILLKLSDVTKKSGDILVYKPCMKIIPNKYSNFRISLMGFQVGIDAMADFSKTAFENYKANTKLNPKSINEFFELYPFKKEPIIIVSAGPSLDRDIETLKKIQGKIKLFVVGSAFKSLIKNNIKPDMICIIDADEVIYQQIKGYENLDIPLCFLNTASRWAVKEYKGPKFIFFNEKNENNTIIDTGKSVATALFSIALKGGANPIIFVGQDLAYNGNKTHCSIFPHDNITLKNKFNEKVEGVNGEILNTTHQLLYYKQWFENNIINNPNKKFINCSSGARIKGTIEMDLKDVYKIYAGK